MMTLVLLPGMDGSGDLFADFIAALGPEIETIVVSYPADQVLDYAALGRLTRAFIPLDRPFVILGESFSGPIAISIAASQPSGMLGLVLCCSFARNPLLRLAGMGRLFSYLPVKHIPVSLLSIFLLGRFSSARLRAALRQALAPVSAAVLRARARAILSVNMTAQCAQIKMPVLYLRATQDRLVSNTSSEEIARHINNLRVAEMEAPHMLLQVAPVAAAGLIKGFVGELSPG